MSFFLFPSSLSIFLSPFEQESSYGEDILPGKQSMEQVVWIQWEELSGKLSLGPWQDCSLMLAEVITNDKWEGGGGLTENADLS